MLKAQVFRRNTAEDTAKQLIDFLNDHAADPNLTVIVVYQEDTALPDKGFVTPEQADVLRDQWP